MPRPGGYSGLYRLFDGTPWRHVYCPTTKKPLVFPKAKDALEAARRVVREKLNPSLKTEIVQGEPEDDPDDLELQKWREDKQEQYAKSRAMVRNGKRHRQAVVETRGKGIKHGKGKGSKAANEAASQRTVPGSQSVRGTVEQREGGPHRVSPRTVLTLHRGSKDPE